VVIGVFMMLYLQPYRKQTEAGNSASPAKGLKRETRSVSWLHTSIVAGIGDHGNRSYSTFSLIRRRLLGMSGFRQLETSG
jgi:hypothetical protein